MGVHCRCGRATPPTAAIALPARTVLLADAPRLRVDEGVALSSPAPGSTAAAVLLAEAPKLREGVGVLLRDTRAPQTTMREPPPSATADSQRPVVT